MKVEIVEATGMHILACLVNMRDIERGLCEKLWGADYEKGAIKLYEQSLLSYAGLVDGKCVVVWGVCTDRILSEEGYVWVLGSKFIEDHPTIFLRHSKRVLRDLYKTFRRLGGLVLTEYECSQRWLEWLGFELGPDQGGVRVFATR